MPKSDLPVTLPQLNEFSGKDCSLAAAKDWINVHCPKYIPIHVLHFKYSDGIFYQIKKIAYTKFIPVFGTIHLYQFWITVYFSKLSSAFTMLQRVLDSLLITYEFLLFCFSLIDVVDQLLEKLTPWIHLSIALGTFCGI